MPVFLERFVLPLFAAGVVLLAATNPMGFDTTQRVTGTVALIFAAYFVAHTVYKAPKLSPPVSAPPAQPAQPQPNDQKDVPPQKEKKNNRHPLPVRKIQFTEEVVSSTKEAVPFAIRVVIQTNVPTQPTSLVLKCSSDVAEGEYRMVGVGAFRDAGDGYINNDHKTFWFFFSDPPFKPDTPIIVLLMAKQSIHVLSVEEGPAR
jgi:hypothetical protein